MFAHTTVVTIQQRERSRCGPSRGLANCNSSHTHATTHVRAHVHVHVYVTSLDSSMYVYPIYVSMPVSCLGRAPTTTKKDGEAKESVVAEIPTNYETCERDLWMLGLGGYVST